MNSTMNTLSRTFSVAPMMDWTDRHCRAFHRTLTKNTLLYTEMITADAVIHGDRQKLLGFSELEHPVAVQLGGSEPEKLAKATKIVCELGYDEVNLNCGCPSERVQSGAFGACLMREPNLVEECVSQMMEASNVPVTVKCRIGIDDDPAEKTLFTFVDAVAKSGCTDFIVHARKAILKGLSPKQNREIPPLNYDLVGKLKRERPHLSVVLNGGLTLDQAIGYLEEFDGVMLGRAAYKTPSILASADRFLEKSELIPHTLTDELDGVENFKPYIEEHLSNGTRLHSITRHMLGLFTGRKGAALWRRTLSTESVRKNAGIEVIDRALETILYNRDD